MREFFPESKSEIKMFNSFLSPQRYKKHLSKFSLIMLSATGKFSFKENFSYFLGFSISKNAKFFREENHKVKWIVKILLTV